MIETERDTHTDRESETEREKDRERERESCKVKGCKQSHSFFYSLVHQMTISDSRELSSFR